MHIAVAGIEISIGMAKLAGTFVVRGTQDFVDGCIKHHESGLTGFLRRGKHQAC